MLSIKQLVVENLGPLGDRTLDLDRFNLIYGRNETGKTYLVEFLLRSLFRHASAFRMRDDMGQGKVIVQGLENEPTTLSPDTKEKLEDHWEESGAGLPTNMARLLVVKGAELELTQSNAAGIDRAVLKEALSSEALIDQILDSIPATVREATIVDGRIEAHQRGEIKARSTLREDRQRLRDLSDQVENRYAEGRLRALELTQDELQDEMARQHEAKQYEAYRLQQQRAAIEAKLSKLPQSQLDELKQDIDRYQDKQGELGSLRDKWTEAKDAVMEYPWLEQAIQLWERRGLDASGTSNNLLGIAAAVFLVFGLGLALAGLVLNLAPLGKLILSVASIGIFLLGLSLGIAHVARVRRQMGAVVNVAERRQIEVEFEQHFGRPAGGLAGLKAQEESLRTTQAEFKHLTEAIEDASAAVERLEHGIEGKFSELGAEDVSPDAWAKTSKQMRDWARVQADSMHQIDIRLSELGIDKSDYRSEPAATAYSAERATQLESELGQLDQDIRSAHQDLDSLKQEITRETGDDIGAPWTELLDNLGRRRRETDDDYRATTARILGQVGVAQVLEQLRTEEDQKIRDGLRAPEIGELLSNFTGHSRSLDFEDGEVVVRGDTADYDLLAISTGAREQVLLALRMGFASRIAGGEPLFLLLDDAFQHSDWERRERLVSHVVELAQTGWQVTYLTMDDHLRDLFKNEGESVFGDDFRYHEI